MRKCTWCFRKGKIAKKPLVTEVTIQKMRETSKWKSKHTEEGKAKYRQLNNELRREAEKATAESI
jgi:Fe-S-cluster-containing dehydrogenase component